MGARDARHPFHRQRLEAGLGICVDPVAPPHRIECADHCRPGFRIRQGSGIGAVNRENDVGVLESRLARRDGRPGRGDILVAVSCNLHSALFNRDLGPESDEFLHGLRDRGAARLARGFLEDGDFHPRARG